MIAGGLAWWFNVGGLPGGAAALFVGLAGGAPLIARLVGHSEDSSRLWIAAALLGGLILAGVLNGRSAPGHDQLAARVERYDALGTVVTTERSGSSTCRPRCAALRRVYRSTSTPDVAAATAAAVLTGDGFDTEGRRDRPSTGAISFRDLRLRDRNVVASVSTEPDGDGSRVELSLRATR